MSKLNKGFPSVTVTPAAAIGDVAHFAVTEESLLSVLIENTGNQPLTAFQVNGRPLGFGGQAGGNDPEITLKSATFGTADMHILGCVGAPDSLAAGAKALIYINTMGLSSITLRATSGVLGAILRITGGAYI